MPLIAAQWLLNLGRQEKHYADGIQLENSKLLLVIKFLHELQHRATRLFLDLSASQKSCGRCLRSQKDKMHTPESVGSMMFGGRPRGDSGYALEEELLGGRLRHRYLVKHGLFVVSCLFLLLLLEVILDYYASQLIGTEACSRLDPHFALYRYSSSF